jgi:hypothetical protein
MEAEGHLLSRHQFPLSLAPHISSHLIPRARYAHAIIHGMEFWYKLGVGRLKPRFKQGDIGLYLFECFFSSQFECCHMFDAWLLLDMMQLLVY